MITEELVEAIAQRVAELVTEKLAAAQSRRYLSRQEYASAHGLSLRTVDRMLKAGELRTKRAGKRVLIEIDR